MSSLMDRINHRIGSINKLPEPSVNPQTSLSFHDSPRIQLFFLSILPKLASSGISGVGFYMLPPPLAVFGLLMSMLWLTMLFLVAVPGSDKILRRQSRWMRPVAKATSYFIVIAALVWASVAITVNLNQNNRVTAFFSSQSSTSVLSSLHTIFGYNDATSLCQQAAQNVIDGKNPYANANIVTATIAYGGGDLKVTPLRRGQLANAFPYPNLAELQSLWTQALKHPDVIPPEIESKLNYPSGSFLVLIPFMLIGVNRSWEIYVILLSAAFAFTAFQLKGNNRVIFLLALRVSVELPNLIAVGETGTLQYPFLLLGRVLMKRHWRTSAVMLGIAISIKQISWFYFPFYLILLWRETGVKRLLTAAGIAGGIFLAANLPFFVLGPRLWINSITAPLTDPMFPLGIGINSLISGHIIDIRNPLPFTVLEGLAFIGALIWYYRYCRRFPYTGPLLAVLPIFFAWRSMWSYFFFADIIMLAIILVGDFNAKEAANVQDINNKLPVDE
jgi:uncharacterized membrane protein